MRSLAGDRERLLTRLATIERSLEDVTGSVQKQAACNRLPLPTIATGPGGPRTASENRGRAAADGCANRANAAAPSPPEPPTRVRQFPQPRQLPDLEAIPGRPAAGVDVGGAKDFDGLRTLWNSITTSHSGLFDGLHPIVAVRENNKSRTAELRLVAGPLTDVDIASRICTTLAAAKRYCRLVTVRGPAAGTERHRRRPAGGRQGAARRYARHPDHGLPGAARAGHSRRRCRRPSFRPPGKPTGC